MGEEAVEGRRDGTDGVLEEGKTVLDGGRVEGGGAHEDILGRRLVLGNIIRREGLTEWPFMYLVTEWITISAPWSRGFWT